MPKMKKKRLLFIANVLPRISGNGMAMRVGALLESACRKFDVTLLVIAKSIPQKIKWNEDYWRSICGEVIVIERLPQNRPLSNKDLLAWLFNPAPRLYENTEVEKLISELRFMRGRHFDVGLVSRLANFPLYKVLERDLNLSFGKKVLDLDDVESISHARRLKINGVAPYGKLRYFVELFETFKLRSAEKEIYRTTDAVLICSEGDKRLLNSRYPGEKARVVPNITRNLVSAPDIKYEGRLNLLFVGTLDYGPNEDAVRWMSQEILPCLKKALPDQEISLKVVGRDAPAWMRTEGEKNNFELYSDVPDVNLFYAHCHIVLVPIRYGAGTRIKILEAFGLGRPVVSTDVGAEGLEVEEGRDISIANDAEDFARSIVQIWRDAAHRDKLICNARNTVLQKYSLDCCANALNELLDPSSAVN